jgi:hypothetical protein
VRVAAAVVQLAAVLIVYGDGFITNQSWPSIGQLLTIAAEVTVVVSCAAAVRVLQEWGITKTKNTQLLALELTAARVHNVIFGGIRF